MKSSNRNYFYQVKKVYKTVSYNPKMDTIFMNSENTKTPKPYILLLNISNKINLKRSDKHVAL